MNKNFMICTLPNCNKIFQRMYQFALCLLVSFSSAFAQAPTEMFVCSPCGRDCDKLVFDKSGICPHCNMALIKQTENPREKKAGQVAILLFEGVQIIDFTGPFEVLGQAGYQVITVSANPSVKTNMGMKVNSDYTFTNCPEAGIFIIPGGNISGTRQSAETIKWIKQYSEKSDVVMSVCNGALILAETGLLDGLTATTYHNAITELEKGFPKTKVISDKRFVDNGKFITTAGLSSGIDGALHIIEKLKGKSKAQTVALNLEYDWKPGNNYARASLADKYLKKIFEGDDEGFPSISSTNLLNTEGNEGTWKIEYEVTGNTTSEEIEKFMEKMIVRKMDWKKDKNTHPTKSNWSFTSSEKENWNGFLEVKQASSNTNKFLVVLKIDRLKL
jgi:putative intracellular protease/amidase